MRRDAASRRGRREIGVSGAGVGRDLGGTLRGGYFSQSRNWASSLLMIVPLLVVYELGILYVQVPHAAAADFIKGPLTIFGRRGMLAFNLLVAGGCLVVVSFLRDRGELRLAFFPLMAAEAAIYAFLLAPAVQLVLGGRVADLAIRLPRHVSLASVVVSAGAGVYEELLFRGLLLGFLYFVGLHLLHLKPPLAAVIAILVAAAVFSLMHFLGPAGEPADIARFLFRLVAGVLLGIIFLLRGLAVACYTHAIYNIITFGLQGR